jgi:hypothetical protein
VAYLRELLGIDAGTPETPVLADLARLKPAIEEASGDAEAHGRVISRLRELLAAAEAVNMQEGAGETAGADLESATDEELFALVDDFD